MGDGQVWLQVLVLLASLTVALQHICSKAKGGQKAKCEVEIRQFQGLFLHDVVIILHLFKFCLMCTIFTFSCKHIE